MIFKPVPQDGEKVKGIFAGDVSLDSIFKSGQKMLQDNGVDTKDNALNMLAGVVSADQDDRMVEYKKRQEQAKKETEIRRPGLDKILDSGKKLAQAATTAITEPGTLFAKPLLEKAGVSPMLAGLAGLGIDFAAPVPGGGGKVKAGGKILKETEKFLEKFTGIATKKGYTVVDKSLTEMTDTALISMVKVPEKLRGQGVGSELMIQTLKKLSQNGIDKIEAGLTPLGNNLFKSLENKGVISKIYSDDLLKEGKIDQETWNNLQGGIEVFQINKNALQPVKEAPKIFKGLEDLSTKIVEALKGRSTVSKQFVFDSLSQQGIRQEEKNIITKTLEDYKGKDIPVQEFANKVKTELLPLDLVDSKVRRTRAEAGGFYDFDSSGTLYDNITLSEAERGAVKKYDEHIYESPIKTSAGDTHFDDFGIHNYFAHTRIEDMSNPKRQKDLNLKIVKGSSVSKPYKVIGDGVDQNFATKVEAEKGLKDLAINTKDLKDTRRIIEIQSDLFQKGRLESQLNETKPGWITKNEKAIAKDLKIPQGKVLSAIRKMEGKEYDELFSKYGAVLGKSDYDKLEPYRNTWHERIIREEIKKAAEDGKTKLQFPTGETAMKIEGLNQTERWWKLTDKGTHTGEYLYQENMKIGTQITDGHSPWVITDILRDGKFKAVPKAWYDSVKEQYRITSETLKEAVNKSKNLQRVQEEFDISGKIDTSNPIYKFYQDDVSKFLKKFNAKEITDKQGVGWFEIDISKDMKGIPVQAFGGASTKLLAGTGAGVAAATIFPLIAGKKTEKDQERISMGVKERIDAGDYQGAQNALELVKDQKVRNDLQTLIAQGLNKKEGRSLFPLK